MKKIAVLNNEVEAQVLGSMLEQQEIPHLIKTYRDSAYDGLFEGQMGWGHVEASEENAGKVLALLDTMRSQEKA